MVTNSSNYGSSSKGALGYGGVTDWVVQRKSAVIMTAYLCYLVYFSCAFSPLTYQAWQGLFQSVIFKIITIIVLISIVKHAWIGMWTIATDYLGDFKVRSLFLFICKTLLLAYLIWGIYILWLV